MLGIIGIIAVAFGLMALAWPGITLGVLVLLFGILLIANLEAGAVAVVWLIGLYALVFGALLVFLGFRLRRYQLM
ncbi:MAG: DUF308 domain-containing protein [Desulfobacterales bacterium]|nr:DUF308 domain-containing protein [Desulfobacterales bacterium]